MIYLIHGTDTQKVRAQSHELLSVLQKKKPHAEVFRMNAETWAVADAEMLLGGQGLFEKKYIVVFDGVFVLDEPGGAAEFILERLSEFKDSENVFILIESSEGKKKVLDKKTLAKLEKAAQKVWALDVKESAGASAKKDSFNIFSLTDALGARDRAKLWMLLQKAVGEGKEPEEIHGILAWQVRSMLLAARAESATEAGLAPFVFSKARSFAKNFSSEELSEISSQLIRLYHDAHSGRADFSLGLEKFVLTV